MRSIDRQSFDILLEGLYIPQEVIVFVRHLHLIATKPMVHLESIALLSHCEIVTFYTFLTVVP